MRERKYSVLLHVSVQITLNHCTVWSAGVVKASTQEKSEVAASLWYYAMALCNTAKSGNVLSSNITRREEKIQNSNAKHPVSQSLNFKLIIYIRYSCSIHPSGSITVYLGKHYLTSAYCRAVTLFPVAYGVIC